MLGNSPVVATIAVSNLESAKQFYEGVLGLKQVGVNPGGVTYGGQDGKVAIYESQTAGSGQATSASWKVDDVPPVVAELKSKGVSFEQYELPGTTYADGIHSMGDMQAAWFKDPDGNILCVTNDQ